MSVNSHLSSHTICQASIWRYFGCVVAGSCLITDQLISDKKVTDLRWFKPLDCIIPISLFCEYSFSFYIILTGHTSVYIDTSRSDDGIEEPTPTTGGYNN